MTEWQSKDTAPMDGTYIVGMAKSMRHWNAPSCFFYKIEDWVWCEVTQLNDVEYGSAFCSIGSLPEDFVWLPHPYLEKWVAPKMIDANKLIDWIRDCENNDIDRDGRNQILNKIEEMIKENE